MKKSAEGKKGNSLELLLKKGVAGKVFPGVAAGVSMYVYGQEKKTIFTAGKTRSDGTGTPIHNETIFDLASLTKPLCSLLAVLQLIEKKKIRAADTLVELLPWHLSPEYREIRLDQLLSHSAGLAPYKPFFRDYAPVIRQRSYRGFVQKILKEKLEYSPGTRCIYSDLGYMILGWIIENVSGEPLNQYFQKEIAAPLKIEKEIFFLPLGSKTGQTEMNIAATEACPWRKKILQGEVHDEHSWLLKGISGHAGLFGTVNGVLRTGEAILQAWHGKKAFPGISAKLLKKALTRKYENQTWCLGFDTPSAEGSSSGKYFSPKSIGHLGFTGTSVWIDPEKDIVAVLLSNRVHPSRKNNRIKKFRPVFHNTVIKAFHKA